MGGGEGHEGRNLRFRARQKLQNEERDENVRTMDDQPVVVGNEQWPRPATKYRGINFVPQRILD
jgi:hypothetical protein